MVAPCSSNYSLLSSFYSEDTKQKAENSHQQTYGLKFSHLKHLEKILGKIEGVAFPSAMGISHEMVLALLKKQVPAVFERWEELGHKYHQHLKEKNKPADSAFLESIGKSLFEIREMILAAFLEVNIVTSEMEAWLQQLGNRSGSLMVRSSGVEDGQKIVNAGGNLSLSNVQPNVEAVHQAFSRVVASYFEIKSLKNLIDGGINPFSSFPVVALFMQELIGEQNGKEIPVSAVMFTQEPTFSEKEFRVTQISCTYGHGEAVVNNIGIGCDTVLATRSRFNPQELFEIYQNRPKRERLIPTDRGLVKVCNSDHFVEARCLSPQMVQRLVSLGTVVEERLGYPTDLELVIQGDTIHIVQAREIFRPKSRSTYISERLIEKENKKFHKAFQGKIQVVGKPEVQWISLAELLICDSLLQAETEFISGKHKVVIVKREEVSNTHPLVNFASRGITCLQFQEIEKIKSILRASPSACLAICPQSEAMGICDHDFEKKVVVAEGYYSHPAGTEMSHDLNVELPKINQPQLSWIIDLIRALKEAETKEAVTEALNHLSTCYHIGKLDQSIKRLHVDVSAQQDISNTVLGIVTLFERLKSVVERVLAEIDACYKKFAGPLETLFYIKTFENLVSSDQRGLVNHYTLDHVPLYMAEVSHIHRVQGKIEAKLLDQLFFVRQYALNKIHENRWDQFLHLIQESGICSELIGRFAEALKLFEQCDVLAFWYNVCFIKANLNHYLAVIDEVLKIAKSNFIEEISLRKILMVQLKENLAGFRDPRNFEQLWKQIQELTSYVTAKEFYQKVHSSSKLERAVALQLMKDYIELVDQAIKTVKQSDLFSEAAKLKTIDKMVKGNFETLSSWAFKLAKYIPTQSDWSLERYFAMIEDRLRLAAYGTEALLPSKGFSVQAAALSSRTSYQRHLPDTLEDIFTLVHQNQLFIVALLLGSVFNDDEIVDFGEINLFQSTNLSLGWKANLIGFQLNKNLIKVQYSIPLRNHSASLTIEYDKLSDQILVHLRFFGEARDRWNVIRNWASLLNHVGMIHLTEEPESTEQEVAFNLIIRNPKDLSVFGIEFQQMRDYSMEIGGGPLEGLINRIIRKKLEQQAGEWGFKHPAVINSSELRYLIRDYLKTPSGLARCKSLLDSMGISDSPEVLEADGNYYRALVIDQLSNGMFARQEWFVHSLSLMNRLIDKMPAVGLQCLHWALSNLKRYPELSDLVPKVVEKNFNSNDESVLHALYCIISSALRKNIDIRPLEGIVARYLLSSDSLLVSDGYELLRACYNKKIPLKNTEELLAQLKTRLTEFEEGRQARSYLEAAIKLLTNLNHT